MDTVTILEKLGLNHRESRMYLALLESGPLTISGIAKRTGIHRPLIYKTIPALLGKSLITVFPKGKQKLYIAESPEKLKIVFDEFSQELQEFLPELEGMYDARGNRPIVKYLEGKKGISFVFEDLVTSLKRGDIYYRYTSNKDIIKSDRYLPRNYRKIRDQKQLERFIINNEVTDMQKKPRLGRETKTVPQKYGLFDYDISQIIYGNKVAFIDYNTETAFIVENPKIAEFQKKIFKIVYEKL